MLRILFAVCLFTAANAQTDTDPYRWLEDVDSEKSMEWVHAQNARTFDHLKADPLFDEVLDQARTILNNQSRIPTVSQRGEWLYNFWRDDEHPRGVYRRTTLEQLRTAEPEWETVLDMDALSETEGEKWAFRGLDCLPPEYELCLAQLSPGGGDATVLREFNARTLQFIDGGFSLPKSKMQVDWRDKDSIFVATDFGPDSMTESGYPRQVRIWQRGEALDDAKVVYTADKQAVWARAGRLRMDEGDIDIVFEGETFWTSKYFAYADGKTMPLAIPTTANLVGGYKGRLLLFLTEPWDFGGNTYPTGSVLVAHPSALSGGEGDIDLVVRPSRDLVVESVSVVDDAILVTALDNVRGRLFRYYESGGKWSRETVEFPDNGHLSITSTDDDSGSYFVAYESFTTPPTLYYVAGGESSPVPIKAQDATFDGSRFEVDQHVVASADGTRVPYFVVRSKDMKHDGTNPTHIFSYGGFRNALTPSYSGSYESLSGAYGKLWLERGGVFVLANIRGGGEFGPEWHAEALLKNRHKAFEDFEAIAEDLIRRKITSSEHLGIEGRSNGGLLVGATMTRRPDLYGAVICGVPLLDMRVYHTLLAGASWMAEYGDPDDPDMWSYIKTYSPYQNVIPDADYPPIFFYTSTRDDRVHPGHARKMAARMMSQGHTVWYYENTEGGHGGSSTNEQLALRVALGYVHLWNALR